MSAVIVLTNVPEPAIAERIAARLIEERCAACVNILSGCTSIYRWQGALERSAEIPLLIKTTQAQYAAVEQLIKSEHPYELPEIVAVPVIRGLPAYLNWIEAQVAFLA